ncbi:MAG: PAS domain-containing sensor histidine kinase [Aggregatilineales bacterium]
MTFFDSAGANRNAESSASYSMRCVFTQTGIVRHANDRFLALVGMDEITLIGDSLEQYIHPEDFPRLMDALSNNFRNENTTTRELRWQLPDQSYLWLSWHIQPDTGGFHAIIHDISTRKALERAMGEDMIYYQGLLQSQIDLVCRYLPDTTLVFVNDAYCRYFNIDRETWLGKSFLALAIPENYRAIHERIEEVLNDPSPRETVTRTIFSDGEYHWIQWIDYGIVDALNNVVAIQAVGRDITSLKRAEAQLAQEREVVEFRKRLMSMISHDFRTPLAVIQSASNMLQTYRAKLDEDRQDMYLERINVQVQRLIHMLDDMLLLDKSESHKLQILPETVNIADFFNAMVDDFRMAYPNHVIVLTIHSSNDPYCSDSTALEHIFDNLIGNALRYSLAGKSVTIEIHQQEEILYAQVSDDGIGIPEEAQTHIFDNFYRANNTIGIAGTGLGLSIVKQYVDLLGGTITFVSKINQGTQFTVTLPSMCDVEHE